MECNFVVGHKVVCVLEKRTRCNMLLIDEPFHPKVGSIYTIREITIGVVGAKACLKLEEIPDQRIRAYVNGEFVIGDLVYESVAFKPLTERKTDISIFTDMLIENKQPVTT